MSSSSSPSTQQSSHGGPSRCGRVLGPALNSFIRNAAWRKHSQLVAAAKSALEKLETITDFTTANADLTSPLWCVSVSDAELVLQPLISALESNYTKLVEPALDCAAKLFSQGLFRGEIDGGNKGFVLFRVVDAVCKCGIGEESVELGVLRVLLSAVRSRSVLIRGDCLVSTVRTCYNIYLGGVNVTNQICAKAVLAQIVMVVFGRVEVDSVDVEVRTVSIGELFEFTDKGLNEANLLLFCQNFVNEVVGAGDGVADNNAVRPWLELQNGRSEDVESRSKEGEGNETSEGGESGGGSKIREDALLLFKNLCKLSMKFSSQEDPDDEILLRGKILSLELLKVVMDNAGPIWRTNDRFLNAVKQYLCLSLLKNSALSVMAIFQLQCAIFLTLLTKLRSGLKDEIGIFFPMLVLRVVENVLQPSFVQKMFVLNLLDKISQDSQIMIDIFVNYDCDVDSPNLFERTVNGLLKTALGPPAGSTTNLTPVQDIQFRHESVKCLVSIIKSMGTWMNQQLRIGDSYQLKQTETDNLTENHVVSNGEEGIGSDADLHAEVNSEVSDAVTLEQRRAYKLELQKGISLFNRKPAKGIDFLVSTKKVDGSPEAVATFLKSTTGLNGTMIGDYLGEREEFPLKVMHAYVDSYNFKGMDFGEAIRFFLQGFRLPGEAQKIDRIMEKFAERYCKCNPNSFSSADTAYVLAYSVIMLNTDAHNSMVKDKMTKADFIRNNRGIDNGKDLPEEYLGAIYDKIVKNEIKMHAETSAPQNKQAISFNKLLGLDGILNLVTGKQSEEKPLGANGLLIRHIQEQFRAKSGKSESVYHVVADVAILRFMVEVCWGPMLAAFSVTLDQSDDRLATSQCLQGFRYAVHVTTVMGMQTQRDAFVTSVAKFTYLHCAADMKQKNVDAVKAIISIAIEDGNYLQEAWEHILTCLSRIEHLQLLGEGAPTDASFLTSSNFDTEDKKEKSAGFSSLKKKGTLQNPAVMAVVRGGSYDSASRGVSSPRLVTQEQITNFISNLNLLDQIGTFELNHVFAHSQRLNSEAIVAFVRALCKVSMSELQSPTDPRVFSLTKLVEIAHYNMNRIRLVWSRIWNVLSDFFVSVGLSDNLSVSFFVMDSLRQLAMKFLEREELANYNFQNEFLRPFVIVMQKSNSAEIRELIVRCISQMVLTRVSNVKSGWKSVFLVFTAAATDERKNIAILAFETMEKIVREYFPYITETETVTFTDCVRCLIAFTNSKFNSDVSLSAIAFLRFCAVKLADGGLVCDGKSKVDNYSMTVPNENTSDVQTIAEKDVHALYWVPLLTGLSKLTYDQRSAIRKSALEVLFNILKDHGHLFSRSFWFTIFHSVVLPMFSCVSSAGEMHTKDDQLLSTSRVTHSEGSTWDSETSMVATQCLVDLFVSFFDDLRSLLPSLVSVLTALIRNPVLIYANSGLKALLHLTSELGKRLSEEEWRAIFLSLKDAISSSLPVFMRVLRTMDDVKVFKSIEAHTDTDMTSSNEYADDDMEDDNLQSAAYVVSRMRSHISMQLLIMQVVADLYRMHKKSLSPANVKILLDILSSTVSHAHQLNSETTLRKKLQSVCSILEISGPPIVSFENDSYRIYLGFLQDILRYNPSISKEMNLEQELVALCENIFQIYLHCTRTQSSQKRTDNKPVHYIFPMSLEKREELATRSKLVVTALESLSGLERDCFKGHVSRVFPLLVDLVRTEHSSKEVQLSLSQVFESCIGPMIGTE